MRRLQYAILNLDGTYGVPKMMGGAIGASISPNFAEASLYSDDTLKEYISSFQSATISLTVDDDDDKIFAQLLGKNYDEVTKLVSSSVNDTSPFVGISYITNKIQNNIQRWRSQFFPKVKFKPFIPEAKTKGDSIEFSPITIEGLTLANSLGIWETHLDTGAETEAILEANRFFESEVA